MTKRITIAGAGLAGSLLAIFLAKRGIEVTVLESRADLRKVKLSAGRSINLALANRGISALRAAGVMDRVEPLLIKMRGRMLHTRSGETSLSPYGQTEDEVIYSVSRGALNGVLLDAAEDTGRVDLRFGQAWPAAPDSDARPLIGADGGGSAVRHMLVERYGAHSSEQLIDHGYKELTMPAADGRHAMERSALHIWPRGGYMLIALPNLNGSFTVTLFLPMTGENSFASLADGKAGEAFFAREFPDALALLPDLADEFTRNPVGRMGTVRAQPWRQDGEVVLLGDAAHAIVPFHGQGMNCAFEDCEALDGCLARHGGDWVRVFADFEAARKPNADAIAEMALENFVEMRDLVANPRFQLQKQIAFTLERRHPGRFIPRYAMVMFHAMPYAEAQRRGVVQQGILDELTNAIQRIEDVDFARADRLIEERCRW
ncbi:MAG: NAD(P)/FAD-dependent oxidoreductase [Gammaproteobacteria bacterium]